MEENTTNLDNNVDTNGTETNVGYSVSTNIHNNHGNDNTRVEANASETETNEQVHNFQIGENMDNKAQESAEIENKTETSETSPNVIEWDEDYYKKAKEALTPIAGKTSEEGVYNSVFGQELDKAKKAKDDALSKMNESNEAAKKAQEEESALKQEYEELDKEWGKMLQKQSIVSAINAKPDTLRLQKGTFTDPKSGNTYTVDHNDDGKMAITTTFTDRNGNAEEFTFLVSEVPSTSDLEEVSNKTREAAEKYKNANEKTFEAKLWADEAKKTYDKANAELEKYINTEKKYRDYITNYEKAVNNTNYEKAVNNTEPVRTTKEEQEKNIAELENLLKEIETYEGQQESSVYDTTDYDTTDLDKYLSEYWKTHKDDNLALSQGVRIGEKWTSIRDEPLEGPAKELEKKLDKAANRFEKAEEEYNNLNAAYKELSELIPPTAGKDEIENIISNNGSRKILKLYNIIQKSDSILDEYNTSQKDYLNLLSEYNKGNQQYLQQFRTSLDASKVFKNKITEAIKAAKRGEPVDLEGLKEEYKTLVSDVYQNEYNKIQSDVLGYKDYQAQVIEDFKKEYLEMQKLQQETPNSTAEKEFWQRLADWAVASEKATRNALGGYADLDLATAFLGFQSKSDFYNKLGIEKPNKSDYENKEDYKAAVKDYKNLWKEYMNSDRTKEYLALKDLRDMAYALATYAAQNGADVNGTQLSNQGVIEWYSPKASQSIIDNLVNGTVNAFKEMGNDFVDLFVPGEYRPIDTTNKNTEEWQRAAINLYNKIDTKAPDTIAAEETYRAVSNAFVQNEDIYNATLADIKTKKGLIAEALKLFSEGAYWTNTTNQQQKAMNSGLKNLVAAIYYNCTGNREAADHALIKSSIILAAYFPKEAQDTQMAKLAEAFGLVKDGEIENDELEDTIVSQIEADSEIENDIPIDSENEELINSIYAKAADVDKYGEWNKGLENDLKTNIENDELLRRQYS